MFFGVFNFFNCYKMLKFQKKKSFGLQIYERKLRTFDLSKKVLFVHFIQQKPPNNTFGINDIMVVIMAF